MGTECASRDVRLMTEIVDEKGNNSYNSNSKELVIEYNFEFKNYNEYFAMMQILKEKIKEIIGKITSLNHFVCPKKQKDESEFEYYEYLSNITTENLCTSALSVYQKIGAVYGESMPFPKEELSKITFALISKYKAYESQIEDEEFTGKFVVDKVIRRINFFTEEFPYKLKRIDKIILSKNIYCFGFDRNLRLNIFIEPEGFNSTIPVKNFDHVFKDRSNPELKEEFFFFEKKRNEFKEKIKINNSDYLTYIYFIIEIVLPILKERFNFSDIINLFINFNGNEADTELIAYIMTNFNNYYPMGIGKVNIVNFQIEKLISNRSFRNEVGKFDIFRNIIFHNESYQFQLVKSTDINHLPIKYGGYHSMEGFELPSSPSLNDFINYTLSMILIN